MTLLPPLHTDTPPHHSPALWEGPRGGSPMWPAPPAAWTGNFWSFHAGGSWDPVADDGGISKDGCAAAGSWRLFARDRQQLRGSELLLVTCWHCPPPVPTGFLCSGRPLGRLQGPCAQRVFQACLGSLGGTSAKTDGRCGGGRWRGGGPHTLAHLEQLLDPGSLRRNKNTSTAAPARGESLRVTACKVILHLNFIYKSWFLQTSSNLHRWPLTPKSKNNKACDSGPPFLSGQMCCRTFREAHSLWPGSKPSPPVYSHSPLLPCWWGAAMVP